MEKKKIRSITLAALLLCLALALSFAVGSLATVKRAFAADYLPSEIFSSGTGGGVKDDETYIRLELDNEGSVHFRRDLALKWFEPQAQGESAEGVRANPGTLKYFSFTFEFPEINFERLSLSFESSEENISKEGTSANSLVFLGSGENVTAAVRDASDQPEDDEDDSEWTPESTIPVEAKGDIVVSFDEKGCDVGEFAVYVNGTLAGKFTNIGANYLEYLSTASSTPRVPMTVKADKLASGKEKQAILAKDLNGQSLELKDGKVVDNKAPALVLNEEVYAYTLGRKWSLTYEAIDVCDSSVTVNRRFAMLKAPEDGKYTKPALPTLQEDGKEGESGDYKSLTTSTFFVPTSDDGSEEQYVSIYFDLDDGRTRTNEEKQAEYIYLTWYAVDDAVKTMGEGEDQFDYILVNRQKGGPHYVGVAANDDTKENTADDEARRLAEDYQKLVDEQTHETDDDGNRVLSLSAGKGAYFYLPSLRGLIASDYSDYRNFRFSVYYKKQSLEVGSSASSATSLRYNALRFEIDEEGKYVFKVLATDAAGNAMQYYVDGKLVDVSSSNIWDIDEIPEFSFEVTYKGATIEDPGVQTTGYRDSTYTVSSFEVVALDGYDSEYELYYLPDSQDLPSDPERLAKEIESYMKDHADSLREIKPFNSEVTEDEKDRWDRTDNKYHWNPDSSLSFVPQEAGYYVVKLTVSEARMPGKTATAYQVIEVRNPLDPIPNKTEWIENNIVSVVLFSISAVLLIIIVILFVVKPSEKSVEEVDLESLKGKRNKKQDK